MKRKLWVAVVLVGATTACKKDDKKQAPVAEASGTAAAAPDAAAPVEPEGDPQPDRPQVEDGALDKVLAERKLAADAVVHRSGTMHSEWGVVVTKKNDLDDPVEYTVIRVVAGGAVTEVKVAPPPGEEVSLTGVTGLEARDLDGDLVDDAIIRIGWSRYVGQTLPGNCETSCWVKTMEDGEDLHLIGGKDALKDAFVHVIAYTSSSSAAEDVTAYADDEEITYSWAVLSEAKPPTVTLQRKTYKVAAEDRLEVALDPAKDPRFAAGEAKDLPVTF